MEGRGPWGQLRNEPRLVWRWQRLAILWELGLTEAPCLNPPGKEESLIFM